MLVLQEQTCIAATRLAWTAVILNSSETTSGPLPNGRALKMYYTVKAVYIKSFGGQKGGSSEPLEPPPLPICGPDMHAQQYVNTHIFISLKLNNYECVTVYRSQLCVPYRVLLTRTL